MQIRVEVKTQGGRIPVLGGVGAEREADILQVQL